MFAPRPSNTGYGTSTRQGGVQSDTAVVAAVSAAAPPVPDHADKSHFVNLPEHLDELPLLDRDAPFFDFPAWNDPAKIDKLIRLLPPKSNAASKGGMSRAVWAGMVARAESEEEYFNWIGRPDRAQHWYLCRHQAIADHGDKRQQQDHLWQENKRARLQRVEQDLGARVMEENSMRDRMRDYLSKLPVNPGGAIAAVAPAPQPAYNGAIPVAPAVMNMPAAASDPVGLVIDVSPPTAPLVLEPRDLVPDSDRLVESLQILRSLSDTCWLDIAAVCQHLGWNLCRLRWASKALEQKGYMQRAFGHVRLASPSSASLPHRCAATAYNLYGLIQSLTTRFLSLWVSSTMWHWASVTGLPASSTWR